MILRLKYIDWSAMKLKIAHLQIWLLVCAYLFAGTGLLTMGMVTLEESEHHHNIALATVQNENYIILNHPYDHSCPGSTEFRHPPGDHSHHILLPHTLTQQFCSPFVQLAAYFLPAHRVSPLPLVWQPSNTFHQRILTLAKPPPQFTQEQLKTVILLI